MQTSCSAGVIVRQGSEPECGYQTVKSRAIDSDGAGECHFQLTCSLELNGDYRADCGSEVVFTSLMVFTGQQKQYWRCETIGFARSSTQRRARYGDLHD